MKNIKMIIKNKLSEAEANEMVRDAKIKESLELGKDVCKAVKEFFVTQKLLTEINSIVITLVLKIQSPDKVIDFIPIACCNVLYKCINKIITERMKKFLRKLVGKNQSAFVSNMHIQDNILSSQELLKGYERKEWPKRVSMKIDIQKAYDTMNWKFLDAFSMVLAFIKGWRQRLETGSMKLTHVCFVDDLLIFCHGDMNYVNVLKEFIEDFGAYSGLIINYTKSAIIFGSTNNAEKENILDNISFTVERLPVKYLGEPLTSKRIGYPNLSLIQNVVTDEFKQDEMVWRSHNGREGSYSNISKHGFIMWMAIHERLATQDKIKS
ncbi:RNA-directed DNA polymerase, eukaryota, reverse transcriptase zinc-binding domain protein [Tanacetum coccineum]